jgi:hypothetical protein
MEATQDEIYRQTGGDGLPIITSLLHLVKRTDKIK